MTSAPIKRKTRPALSESSMALILIAIAVIVFGLLNLVEFGRLD